MVIPRVTIPAQKENALQSKKSSDTSVLNIPRLGSEHSKRKPAIIGGLFLYSFNPAALAIIINGIKNRANIRLPPF